MNIRPLLFLTSLLLTYAGCHRPQVVSPFDEDRIELTYDRDGQRYHLGDDGNAYRETDSGKSWELVKSIFDPEHVQRSYVTEDGITYRVAPDTQRRFEVQNELTDSFEDLRPGLPGLIELVSEERRKWATFTLQSPKTPTVPEYVDYRNKLLAGSAELNDCRVEPSMERAHSGSKSLKCVAPPKPDSMITCKASLESPLVYFRNADNFWYEAYYLAEGSLPLTLIDLECEFVQEHPGIRLRIFEDGALGVELKALDKPQFRQEAESRVVFPKGKWVCVRVHFFLSPTEGKMEVWQDGQKVLDKSGMTLPFRSAVYNSLEIGISAHGNPNESCSLFVDDLRCSSSEFP